jgi:hypothetical protein
MSTFLIILSAIILALIALAWYSSYKRRPKFFKGGLKPLEKALYTELQNHLPVTITPLIPSQLSHLKRGVRLYFPGSYTLELYENKDNPIDENSLFERKDNFKLATISFTSGTTKYKAEFQTYSGRIWGLIVRPNPKNILGINKIHVEKFKLNNDPSEKLNLEIIPEFYDPTDIFEGIVAVLKSKYNLKDIQKPLPENQQHLFIRLSETKFPPGYLELIKQTNGFTVDDAKVYGLGPFEPVPLDDGNYLTIAEKSTGCLGIKQSQRKTSLKYFSYEDETDVRDLGEEYLTALQKFIEIE